ncbi:hypothetical protein BN946_scf184785.g32 [Trametes cinnabarina]|uniref:Uncharacterized protein n=1 Tax=Pycnoporus cinnabarinus TaxID=5643 RepID=A0A060S502_PYCCI|nr:hypothetical protein BN946_scf184785.g32 [Trametes cinnabarina]
MVPPLATNPRAPHSSKPSCTTPKAPSQPSDPSDDPFYYQFVPDSHSIKSAPQLLPPFRLPEEAGRSKLSKPQPAPCSPTKRRRGLNSNLSRSTRRRHGPRSEYCINTFPRAYTSFDDIPWISALTIEPDPTDPWDIADLSMLKADWDQLADGPGPVRRRKTSLRSDPLAATAPRNEPPSPVPFPFIHQDGVPQTPAPRYLADSSEIIFRDLHPIFPVDVEYASNTADVETSP